MVDSGLDTGYQRFGINLSQIHNSHVNDTDTIFALGDMTKILDTKIHPR
jgi:hypothetical protein